jgi:hypothetical protein
MEHGITSRHRGIHDFAVSDVAPHEPGLVVQVLLVAGRDVVQDDGLVTLAQKEPDHVAADESRATSDERFHATPAAERWPTMMRATVSDTLSTRYS